MSLHDEIEKIDKEIEAVTKPEKETKDGANAKQADDNGKDDVSSVSDDKSVGRADNDKKRKEVKKEEPKAEESDDKKDDHVADSGKKAEEEKVDNAAYAKLRRDQKAAEKRAEEAERRAAAAEARFKEAPSQPQPGEATIKARADAEPDANLDPEAHLRWELSKTRQELKEVADWKVKNEKAERNKQLREGAVKAFEGYENAFAPTVGDYLEVTTFGVQKISNSIRTLNPSLKGNDLQEAVRNQVLRLAAIAESQGYDPAEHFYEQSKSWGYQPPKAALKEEEEAPKQTVKKMAEHKKKTAGSLSHGGKSGNAPLSRESLEGMKFSDFAKLTPKDLRDLEQLEA